MFPFNKGFRAVFAPKITLKILMVKISPFSVIYFNSLKLNLYPDF